MLAVKDKTKDKIMIFHFVAMVCTKTNSILIFWP